MLFRSNDTATTEIYTDMHTLSLHDALPIFECRIRMLELRLLKQLQLQQSDPHGTVPPASAREECASLAALIDSINQVTEMASDPAPAANGRRRTATAASAVSPELATLGDDSVAGGLAAASEKDQFRRELAEHLGKMLREVKTARFCWISAISCRNLVAVFGGDRWRSGSASGSRRAKSARPG